MNAKEENESDPEFRFPITSISKVVKRRPRNIVTADLSGTLDRVGLSDRKATQVLAAAVRSEMKDLKDLVISRSTIRRARMKHRLETARKIMNEFNPSGPLVGHWDSKMLPNVVDKQVSDRVAVIVTGHRVEKLLGVPKLQSGKGLRKLMPLLNW